MKTIVLLLILFCLCEGQKKPPGEPPGKKDTSGLGNGCPKGWMRSRDVDRCYYVSGNFDTFDHANKFCKDANAQLVPPITCDSHIDLSELLAHQRGKCRRGQNCEEFWIGIHNPSGGNWQTTKDLELEKNRLCQQWAKDFPKPNEGNCSIMSFRGTKKTRGAWRNANCTRNLKYVCISCPNNFEYFPEINECLYFNPNKANWSVAQKTCAQIEKKAQLLTIQYAKKSEAVKKYVQPLLAMHGKACDYTNWKPLGVKIWIGAQTLHPAECRTPYVWKQVAGATIPFSYSNWFTGVPNCGYNIENCVAIGTSRLYNYRWDDLPCSDTFCYVCEL